VHKTLYQLFRGVRDGTKCSKSPHCLQCVKEVVRLSKLQQRMCLPRSSKIGCTFRNGLKYEVVKPPLLNHDIIYNKKWGCLTTCVVQRKLTRSGQKQGVGELNLNRVMKSSISTDLYIYIFWIRKTWNLVYDTVCQWTQCSMMSTPTPYLLVCCFLTYLQPSTTYPKTPPHQDFLITNTLSQGQIPLNSPHLRINCEDPTEYSCPGRISDHVLTSSTKWVRTIRSLVPVRGTTPPSIPLSLHWCQNFDPKSGQTRWSEIGSRVSKPPRTWLRHRD
jgi:hypothetical protein